MRFTEEELRIAKSVDLCAVASHLGYTVRRIGKYHTLKEMDSIRIYNRTHWFRWSRRYEKGENGGSQIDFLRVFAGMDVKEAVFWLLDFTGYKRLESKETLHGVILPNGIAAEERKEFVLPEYAGSNAYLYNYLVNQRGIAKEVVDYFVKALGLINSAGDFCEQPYVMNGFSDLMVEVFGKRGQHARSAMGAYALWENVPVTVEAIVKIRK